MTGKWVLRPHDAPPERFERARLDTASARCATSIRACSARSSACAASARRRRGRALGPDALTDGVDAGRLHARLARISRSIKETLLDQTIARRRRQHPGGRGAVARAAPSRARVVVADGGRGARRWRAASRARSRDTLAREDGPEITYVEEAGADNPFDVYGKQGEPCPRCGTTLVRIVQGGRSTVSAARAVSASAAPRRAPRHVERDRERAEHRRQRERAARRPGAAASPISQPLFFGGIIPGRLSAGIMPASGRRSSRSASRCTSMLPSPSVTLSRTQYALFVCERRHVPVVAVAPVARRRRRQARGELGLRHQRRARVLEAVREIAKRQRRLAVGEPLQVVARVPRAEAVGPHDQRRRQRRRRRALTRIGAFDV